MPPSLHTLGVDSWAPCAIVFGAFLASLPVIILLERRRLRRLARQHLASHRELTDTEFLGLAGVPPDRHLVALGVRKVLAKLTGMPAATIHPADSLRYVMNLMFDNGYLLDLVIGIEEELGVKLPNTILDELVLAKGGLEVCSVDDLMRHLATRWESLQPLPERRDRA